MPGLLLSIRTGAVLLLPLLATAFCLDPAFAYPRRRNNNSHNYAAVRARQQQAAVQAAQAQKKAAEQVLKAAEATGSGAEAKLAEALSKLRQEADRFHDAQSTTRQAAKELAEIEQEIIDEQTEESPYRQASRRVEAARQKMKQLEDRVLSEPANEAKLGDLTGSALAEGREKILSNHTDYLLLKEEFNTQATILAKHRSELFQADQHWKDASDSLAQARKLESEAEGHTHSGTSGRVGLNSKAKNAAEAAAAARAAIAQANAVIKANTKNNPPNKNNGPPNKGKSPGKNNKSK